MEGEGHRDQISNDDDVLYKKSTSSTIDGLSWLLRSWITYLAQEKSRSQSQNPRPTRGVQASAPVSDTVHYLSVRTSCAIKGFSHRSRLSGLLHSQWRDKRAHAHETVASMLVEHMRAHVETVGIDENHNTLNLKPHIVISASIIKIFISNAVRRMRKSHWHVDLRCVPLKFSIRGHCFHS